MNRNVMPREEEKKNRIKKSFEDDSVVRFQNEIPQLSQEQRRKLRFFKKSSFESNPSSQQSEEFKVEIIE